MAVRHGPSIHSVDPGGVSNKDWKGFESRSLWHSGIFVHNFFHFNTNLCLRGCGSMVTMGAWASAEMFQRVPGTCPYKKKWSYKRPNFLKNYRTSVENEINPHLLFIIYLKMAKRHKYTELSTRPLKGLEWPLCLTTILNDSFNESEHLGKKNFPLRWLE